MLQYLVTAQRQLYKKKKHMNADNVRAAASRWQYKADLILQHFLIWLVYWLNFGSDFFVLCCFNLNNL